MNILDNDGINYDDKIASYECYRDELEQRLENFEYKTKEKEFRKSDENISWDEYKKEEQENEK